MTRHTCLFTVSYPLGIEDKRMKILMYGFTEMMFNGFAHYDLIESVILTWDRVFITVEDHVKEYVLQENKLRYLTSHEKENFVFPA